MRWPVAGLLAAVAALSAVAATGCSDEQPQDRTVAFRFSRYWPDVVTVSAGVPVTFILRNDDPIEHEWIVGSNEVHERHRVGTGEPYHDAVPNEVTVPALSTRTTTLTFDEPGEYTFVCHLPGHEAYGMRGTLRVVAG